ncbi:MAG: hypothetical protein ACK5XN_22015 [Bacteroidota bacterium]
MRSTRPSDSRSAAEHACFGLTWELTRLHYFERIGNHAKARECQALADQWKAKRDALWLEAQ